MPNEGDLDSESSFPSKQTLRTLPSYLGEYEPKSVILKVPSIWSAKRKEVDTANLHALMSTPVTCTLPLTDLLKIKPELWEYVAKCLTDHGLWNKKFSLEEALDTKTRLSRKSVRTAVPVNQVEEGENDGSNTTLHVLINKVTSVAILDSGAGVGIATKSIWEPWGKPAIRRTRMNLQLADGSLERPIGLLENVAVKSCGIEYTHTFAIVDFGNNANYEVILGRPFMR